VGGRDALTNDPTWREATGARQGISSSCVLEFSNSTEGSKAVSWTPERVETLKKLWADGLSCSQIAMRMSCREHHVTRNGVIGKVHRLGLAGRVTLQRKTYKACRGSGKRTQKPPRPSRFVFGHAQLAMAMGKAIAAEREAIQAGPDLDVPEHERVHLLDLDRHHCRWPYGDGPYTFCGKHRIPGSSYCEFHAARSAAAVQPRRTTDLTQIGKPLKIRTMLPLSAFDKELA